MILRKLELEPYGSNCYIIGSDSTGEGMVIDPGGGAEHIISHIEQLDLQVKLIVLTHGHMDHTGALAPVKAATGAAVAIHPADADYLRGDHPMTQASGGSNEPPTEPDRLLNEGDVIEVGEVQLRVVHTPGHTAGGICLITDGYAFTGDTLFQFSIGRTDFPGGSHEQLVENIHSKLMVLPDETRVCPGHGPDSTIDIERRVNPFL